MRFVRTPTLGSFALAPWLELAALRLFPHRAAPALRAQRPGGPAEPEDRRKRRLGRLRAGAPAAAREAAREVARPRQALPRVPRPWRRHGRPGRKRRGPSRQWRRASRQWRREREQCRRRSGAGDGTKDSGVDAAGGRGDGGTPGTTDDLQAAAVLDRYALLKPCKPGFALSPNPNGDCCCEETAAEENQHKTIKFGGDPNVTYNVKLHVRGVAERYWYEGGMLDGTLFYRGGLPTIHSAATATKNGNLKPGEGALSDHPPETDNLYALPFKVPVEVQPLRRLLQRLQHLRDGRRGAEEDLLPQLHHRLRRQRPSAAQGVQDRLHRDRSPSKGNRKSISTPSTAIITR